MKKKEVFAISPTGVGDRELYELDRRGEIVVCFLVKNKNREQSGTCTQRAGPGAVTS